MADPMKLSDSGGLSAHLIAFCGVVCGKRSKTSDANGACMRLRRFIPTAGSPRGIRRMDRFYLIAASFVDNFIIHYKKDFTAIREFGARGSISRQIPC
jgi:hypothetical protein